jgi:hypothetical protein
MGPESTPVYYARACTCITGRRNPPVRRGGDQGPRARGIGRDPKGAPGTVVRAILPQGPHALGERQRAESDQRGGGHQAGGGAAHPFATDRNRQPSPPAR